MTQRMSWQVMLDESEESGRQAAEVLQGKLHTVPSAEDQESWREEIQELADRIPAQHMTHHLLRRLEKHKFRIGSGLSFHRYMVEDSETRKLRIKSLNWSLNGKTVAYRFVDALGVRRPRTSVESAKLEQVSWQYPGVLKAVSATGSRGCYLLFAEDEAVHVRDGRRFDSQEELISHARRLMKPARVQGWPDRWVMEELILEDAKEGTPARDMKFFCFYGEVLFSLEVVRNQGESQYSFRSPDGVPIKPGSWEYNYFEGRGPTGEMLDLVSNISSEIPHPFMRIDMLCGEDEIVFGEFTPRPGTFQKFDSEWDRRMGEAWARAEERIQRDLLSGKRFDAFLSATNVYGAF